MKTVGNQQFLITWSLIMSIILISITPRPVITTHIDKPCWTMCVYCNKSMIPVISPTLHFHLHYHVKYLITLKSIIEAQIRFSSTQRSHLNTLQKQINEGISYLANRALYIVILLSLYIYIYKATNTNIKMCPWSLHN